jgi:hypothetical protein
MLCCPVPIFEVLNVATPRDKPALPSVVVPFLKVTVPVGIPPSVAVTFAVNFTV